jgi:uncharacterized protein YbbK (DUF523 family)
MHSVYTSNIILSAIVEDFLLGLFFLKKKSPSCSLLIVKANKENGKTIAIIEYLSKCVVIFKVCTTVLTVSSAIAITFH